MADNFRDQINTARRLGYSDDEIIGHLKEKNPKVTEALKEGHSSKEILDYIAPPPSLGEEAVRKNAIFTRGMTESMAPSTAGAVIGATGGALLGLPAGPLGAAAGAIAGGLAVPAGDVLTGMYNKILGKNAKLPSQIISDLIPGPRAETPTERVIESAGSALGGAMPSTAAGAVLKQVAPTAGIRAVGAEMSRRPVEQIVSAPVAAGVGQAVTEATGSALAGLAAGTATSAGFGLQKTKREAVPSSEDLLAKSKANYGVLENSGLQFNRNQFNQRMGALPAHLEVTEGYVSGIYPKVDAAIKRLQEDRPKNVAEISALRKIIGNAAGSSDASERRMGKILLDDFDNYVLNAPAGAITGGDRAAVQAWKEARADYAKVKKAELIQDIVKRAEVTQGSEEAAIAKGLSSLANNSKKMRFFTTEEQQAIRDAAKGGHVQDMLRTIAKFTPMTPAAAIFTAVNPWGAYTAAAGMAAKGLSASRRERQVNRLANQMLLGRQPQVLESPFAAEPIFITRGIQNMLSGEQQNQNALAR